MHQLGNWFVQEKPNEFDLKNQKTLMAIRRQPPKELVEGPEKHPKIPKKLLIAILLQISDPKQIRSSSIPQKQIQATMLNHILTVVILRSWSTILILQKLQISF